MTYEQAEDFYIANIDKAHGKEFAAAVGRFQEGFLADDVTSDLNAAFTRAVDVASRLIPAMKVKA